MFAVIVDCSIHWSTKLDWTCLRKTSMGVRIRIGVLHPLQATPFYVGYYAEYTI